MKKETVEEKISRIATEWTSGYRHQDSKPLLIAELESLVLSAKLETIKELSKKL
jgi:hypothetical protein